MKVNQIVIGLSVWLAIGLLIVMLTNLEHPSMAWWLLLGLPGTIAALGLAFSFVVVIVGLYLSFLRARR